MSKSIEGIVHGITSVIFDCMECGIRYDTRNGVGLAAKHWHKIPYHKPGISSMCSS